MRHALTIAWIAAMAAIAAPLPAVAQSTVISAPALVASIRDACLSVGILPEQRMALLNGWTRLDADRANAAAVRFSGTQAFATFVRENQGGADMPPLADAMAMMQDNAAQSLMRLQDGLERGWITIWQGADGWLLQFRASVSERGEIVVCTLIPGEGSADLSAELIDMVALLPPLAMPVGRAWILGTSQPLERGARNFGISVHLPNIGLNGAAPVPSLTLLYDEFRM
jgi:hypothetical protein